MAVHHHHSWEETRQQLLAQPGAAEAYEAAQRADELGMSVVKLRKQRGWSQKKLAKAAGIRQSVLDDLELGGPIPPYEVLERVAKALEPNSRCDSSRRTRSAVS